MAGLATGIGSIIAFFTRNTNTRFLSLALGFSAGVMIYVSFVEILVKARESLIEPLGPAAGSWVTVAAFFGGIGLIALIDFLIPGEDNPHEVRLVEDLQLAMSRQSDAATQDGSLAENGHPEEQANKARLKRVGLFTALAIAIHNFPEGLVTFTMALTEPATGVAIAIAVAIHNIPEGIAVAVPIYYATGDRKKALGYSFLSGLTEPVGALVGYFLLKPFLGPQMLGVVFAGVAGIMVYICLDELLPAAERYGEHHLCMYGLVAGMAVIAVSLLLLL
ncbi:MAG: zinc transporter ZupT [Syntrophorhabdaceae bacterium]|nr:zinc transporter ZupT [Syntrophorhabdaceae bacterium]